jgi:hypothetical protein
MRLPQTLTPRPSRLLFAAITAGHFGAAVAVGVTSIAYWWGIGPCWLLIAASLGQAVRRLWLERPLAIVLRQDRRMQIEWAAGRRDDARVGKHTVVLSWLIMLDRDCGDQRRFLALPVDSLDPESFRSLRLWLRWRTEPEVSLSR